MYRCHWSTKTNHSKLTSTDIYVVVFILYMNHWNFKSIYFKYQFQGFVAAPVRCILCFVLTNLFVFFLLFFFYKDALIMLNMLRWFYLNLLVESRLKLIYLIFASPSVSKWVTISKDWTSFRRPMNWLYLFMFNWWKSIE